MITAIIGREFTEWARDGRLRWLVGGCVMLLLAMALLGWQTTVSQVEARAAAGEQETANFLSQGAKNPHAAAHFGQYAFRPILLPAAIDPGVSAWMGSMIWMEAHRRNLAEFRPAEDGAGHGQAAGLSVAWVLQYVLPLLVIMIGFAAIAGERERGTLPLLLAQGLRLRTLALGKGLAIGAVILLLLVPTIVAILLLYVTTPTGIDLHDSGPRLVWLGVAHALYLGGFVALALCVSLLAPTARSALLALLVMWVLMVVLVPRLATDFAAARHPLPAATEFWSAIKRGEGAQVSSPLPEERAARIREALATELLARHGVSRLEDLPVNFTAVYLQRLEEADAPVFDHAYGELWSAQERQRGLRSLFGALSPTVGLRELSMGLAGTDPYALRHFGDAAEAHRRLLVAELNGTQARDGAGRGFYVAPADTWQRMPRFTYEPPPLAAVLERHRTDLWWLLWWALAPMTACALLAQRRRVTR
jgi:ABC-2 type transport system permease protein